MHRFVRKMFFPETLINSYQFLVKSAIILAVETICNGKTKGLALLRLNRLTNGYGASGEAILGTQRYL